MAERREWQRDAPEPGTWQALAEAPHLGLRLLPAAGGVLGVPGPPVPRRQLLDPGAVARGCHFSPDKQSSNIIDHDQCLISKNPPTWSAAANADPMMSFTIVVISDLQL